MHAYLLWMEFSRIAREAMINQASVKMLKAPWTFEKFVAMAVKQGKTGDEVWQYIIESSKRIDFLVDKFLGVKNNFQRQEGKIINKPIYICREQNKPLEVEIPAMPSRDGFNKLIDFLVKEYNAVVLFDADGPDARRWILESKGTQFELVHDDLVGSALVAPSVDSEELVLKIGKDLEQRLMGEIIAIGDTIEASVSKNEENAVLTFWNACYDVTEKIYKKLEGKSYFKYLIFGGAPYAYGLIQVSIEYLDELLRDLKTMDKSDLK